MATLTERARDLKSSFITRALRVRKYLNFITHHANNNLSLSFEFTVAQKLEAGAGKPLKIDEKSSSAHDFTLFSELFSIDGAIRVISDDFSISLLNPESELYKYKADKYENMVSTFLLL